MLTLLALGDSYTIGEGVAAAERWPMQLAARLRQQGVALADPQIVARTGWTTDELAAGLAAAQLSPHYDLVTLLIGVNNQYRGRDLTEYRSHFRQQLQQAIALACCNCQRVIVLSIPDWGVTPFANQRDRAQIARAIDRFNEVNRQETLQVGAHYVDITPLSRLAGERPDWLAADGLHPSATMYAQWVELAAPLALRMFGK
jgi:lysophospholipase L1-like esterase